MRDHLRQEPWFRATVQASSPRDKTVIADLCLGIQSDFSGNYLVGHLRTLDQVGQERLTEYLTAALEDDNPEVFLAAVGNIAKARGMRTIADRAGLGRESLYKALHLRE